MDYLFFVSLLLLWLFNLVLLVYLRKLALIGLVLQAATAFYESSCVRAKNITSVLFRNYFDACKFTFRYSVLIW